MLIIVHVNKKTNVIKLNSDTTMNNLIEEKKQIEIQERLKILKKRKNIKMVQVNYQENPEEITDFNPVKKIMPKMLTMSKNVHFDPNKTEIQEIEDAKLKQEKYCKAKQKRIETQKRKKQLRMNVLYGIPLNNDVQSKVKSQSKKKSTKKQEIEYANSDSDDMDDNDIVMNENYKQSHGYNTRHKDKNRSVNNNNNNNNNNEDDEDDNYYDENDEAFWVTEIHTHRIKNGEQEFLVSWEGCGPEQNEWITASSFGSEGTCDLLNEYLDKIAKQNNNDVEKEKEDVVDGDKNTLQSPPKKKQRIDENAKFVAKR